MNNQIFLKHRLKLFDILFKRISNSLEDYRKTLTTTTNTLTIKVKVKNIKKIVFFIKKIKVKRNTEKKCENKKKKEKRGRRFRVEE
jgi:hypothetical protein